MTATTVVCVARVMDTSSPVDFTGLVAGRDPAMAPQAPGLGYILNPADEAGVRLAGALPGTGREVMALHVGPPSGDAALRDALAHGATAAVRLEPPAGTAQDAMGVAEALAAFLREAAPEWIVCGQCTLDWGTGLVAPLLAELLDRPLVDRVVEAAPDGAGAVRCIRLPGGGEREELTVRAPAVLAISPMAFRPVAVPVRDRMRAQRAPIRVEPAASSGRLPRPAAIQVTRPRPRPKDALPAGFGALSAEERLQLLMSRGQPTSAKTTRALAGDAGAMAREILDFILEWGPTPRT